MIERMKMETKDITKQNIDKIQELFPNAITETRDENGRLIKGINFEILKQELSDEVVDGEECFDFTWVGKKEAILESNTPIRKTLRPCIEESKDWKNTENIYIEGDNLEALKLLQESYLNSIKMIYIDPPYNTGNDFVYNDNFKTDKEHYDEQLGMYDEYNNRLFKNTDTNGRFHSDWCSMMYPRLKLAKTLLSEDGVIFISIDDNEVENLKKICNEIFGEENYIASVIWERAYAPVNLKKHFSENHDYALCFSKNKDNTLCKGIKRGEETNDRYKNPDNDHRGLWKSSDLSVGPIIQEKVYEITTPSGRKVNPPNGYCWRLTKERFEEFVSDNRIWFGKSGDNVPSIKRFLSEVKNSITPMTIWKYKDVGHSQQAKQNLIKLFDGKALFDYPKPVDYIKRMIELYSEKNSIVLDFFSGSSTTAHAIMKLNSEDGGKRKFIMIQLPEKCDEDSEAYKADLRNICEIGKERIRRAGEQIKKDIENQLEKQISLDETKNSKKVPDIGFRVFKIDSTNMKDVYYSANEINQSRLKGFESNIKEDRTDLDLLYGILIEWGLPLSYKHEIEEIHGKKVHNVDEDKLIACFEKDIPEDVIREIAKKQPLRVVFRDNSFSSSSEKINVEEIFKLLSPNTTVKVI